MKLSPTAVTVKSRAAELEAELAIVRQLDSVIATIRRIKSQSPHVFETFEAELRSAIEQDPPDFNEEAETPTVTTGFAQSGETLHGVDKLTAFFQSRNNEPATLRQMASGVGLSPRTIKSIVYERYRGKFELTEQRGRRNEAHYRLAENQ